MTWSKSSDQPGNWETVYTRAERGVNNMKSRLTLGDDYTPSDIFDSLPFRGIMLGSDESMVPYNQRAFAPVVRGCQNPSPYRGTSERISYSESDSSTRSICADRFAFDQFRW